MPFYLTEHHIAWLSTLLQQASDAIMKIYDSSDFGIEHKADDSPLTKADKASHEILGAGLHNIFPEIPVLSEEWTAITYAERANRDRSRSVDPLDGTKEFINRNGEFAVCIWLIDHGQAVFGMIALPATGAIYRWWPDYGAWRQQGSVVKELPARERPTGSLHVIGSRSHSGERDHAFLESVAEAGYEPTIVAAGSALKLCKLADGSADVYPRFKPTIERDMAAWDAIMQAVGYQLIDLVTKQPMQYNREQLRNNPCIALHRDAEDLLQFALETL